MLEWAQTNDGAAVAVCSHGLYVDQATATAAAFPGSEIVVGLGSDKVRQLFDASWYRDPDAALTRLFRVARVAYATRGSDRERVRELLDRAGRWRARLAPLVLPPGVGAVSSSEVRRRLRRGADVSALVPEEVRPYLAPSG